MDAAGRAVFRGQITKLTNAATEYLSKPESQVNSRNAENLDSIEEELTVFLQRLTSARDSLNAANKKLRSSIKAEDMQRELEAVVDYEDRAIGALARINQRLAKLRALQRPPNTTLPGSNDSRVSAAKLEKLPLKTFGGNFEDWLPFWDRFRTSVHEQPKLSAADKFNYLQSHLTGKAADSIAGFTPTESNYDAAISMLQEEYGDTEKLVDFFIHKLMTLPHITSRLDCSGLRRLYNQVTASRRSLTALNVPTSHYSVMLKSMLLRCMPKDLTVDFHRSHTLIREVEKNVTFKEENTNEDITSVAGSESSSECNGDAQVRDLLKFLKGEVESLEKSAAFQTPVEKTFNSNASAALKAKSTRTAAGLFTPSYTPSSCFFCNQSTHSTERCNSSHTVTQRKEMLRRQGRCFRCTRKGHSSRSCSNRQITCERCKGNHATSLCDPNHNAKILVINNRVDKTSVKTHKSATTSSGPTSTSLCSPSLQNSANIYLQTACVHVSPVSSLHSPRLFVRIVLDGGSQRSYITETLVKKLNLEVMDNVNMRILPFGSTSSNPKSSFSRVKVNLISQYDKQYITIVAVVVPEICLDILPVPKTSCTEFSQFLLADARTTNNLEPGINILIGADFYWSIVLQESKRLASNLTAINTILGWTIQGSAGGTCFDDNLNLVTPSVVLNANTVLDSDVKRFWDLESLGITDVREKPVSDFKNGDHYISRTAGRYEASLLWKNVDCILDSYRKGAEIRFSKLVQRLLRHQERFLEYDSGMWNLISEGIAERIQVDVPSGPRTYYLSHRPVYRDDKTTTKMSIVFDASARSDIEKAFLQIMLSKIDRDSHRFLWFDKKITDTNHLPDIAEFRMTRVTFGVACSPYILCATLRKHFAEESQNYPETCELLSRSFYMDDLVLSVDNEGEAERIYKDSKVILKKACMNIRKWNTNNQKLKRKICEIEEAPSIQKVLGIIWYCPIDELGVDLERAIKVAATNATKRNVLKLIACVYDPLGIFGPFLIRLKILFQELWRIKINWDEGIPIKLQLVWNNYVSQLHFLKEITLPRNIFKSHQGRLQLHVFADASLQAYGAVAYDRNENGDGSSSISFLCSKNRVAPLKMDNTNELTLPKLELTAALIAARLANYIKDNLKLKLEPTFLWSDSKIALNWISSPQRKWKPYIEHRVREISQLSSEAEWRYCPGSQNPADYLTRGVNGRKLLNSSIWLQGPQWLSSASYDWPSSDFILDNPTMALCIQTPEENVKPLKFLPIFDIIRYSSYLKVIRITGYIKRFVNILISNAPKGHFLTTTELQQAITYWINVTQSQYYETELTALANGKSIPNSSNILTLNPFLDERNVLRVGSRLQEAGMDYDATYPIILPKSVYFTTLLVFDSHERTLHGGVNIVLTRLREKYWIIGCRQLVKAVINRCRVCKILKGRLASEPFAPIPRDRLLASRAFESTGIDFLGPLYVRASSEVADKRKMYIMLATCAVIRAVHLELLPSLSAESCLLALRRFFARRGTPKIIISDNARTFKRASFELNALEKVLDSKRIQEYVLNQGINWKFIVERAPWWGGFYERLVRCVKDTLKVTIGRAVLSEDQLYTFISEAEFAINSRPLTYISDDPFDLTPLTPAHFLLGTFPTSIVASSCSSSDDILRSKWKIRLSTTKAFFKRWKTEYIQRLRTAHHSAQKLSSDLKPGNVVLVHDQSLPRLFWKLAVIEKTFPGRDGKVRACELRFHNGSILRRPVQLLCPLELSTSDNHPPPGGCEK